MSSPFTFRIGYELDFVYYSGSLPNDGATDSFFSLTFSIFLSVARWFVSSFFTNAFVRGDVWNPYPCHSDKTHWLKTFLIVCLFVFF